MNDEIYTSKKEFSQVYECIIYLRHVSKQQMYHKSHNQYFNCRRDKNTRPKKLPQKPKI